MRRDEVFCPGCGEPFPIHTIELSREHRTPLCWWCREIGLVKLRARPMSELEFWQEIAKRLAAYASREGAAIAIKIAGAP